MEWWNSMLCSLPYDWLRYEFMRNALLAVLLVAPIFGLTGTMVVNNRMAFFSDSIGHAALTGVAIGIITGMGNPLWAMIIFAVVFAIFISWFRIKTEASADTVIGVFFAATVALGVVLLSRGGGFNRYSSYLIGDLLSITPQEIGLLILLLIGVLFTWVLYYNKLF
ncbi:MAG: metal ABC transporter permease, partial [Chitinophagales bacterium]